MDVKLLRLIPTGEDIVGREMVYSDDVNNNN